MMLLASVQMRPSICVSIGIHRQSLDNINVAALHQFLLCIYAMLNLRAKLFRVHVCVRTWLSVSVWVCVCWDFTLCECVSVCAWWYLAACEFVCVCVFCHLALWECVCVCVRVGTWLYVSVCACWHFAPCDYWHLVLCVCVCVYACLVCVLVLGCLWLCVCWYLVFVCACVRDTFVTVNGLPSIPRSTFLIMCEISTVTLNTDT
jgi:hypothetical protein